MSEKPSDSAVCGHCSKSWVEHFHEEEDYCFRDTTGDLWTSDPRSEVVADFIEGEHPELYRRMVEEWKAKNGHRAEKQPAPQTV